MGAAGLALAALAAHRQPAAGVDGFAALTAHGAGAGRTSAGPQGCAWAASVQAWAAAAVPFRRPWKVPCSCTCCWGAGGGLAKFLIAAAAEAGVVGVVPWWQRRVFSLCGGGSSGAALTAPRLLLPHAAQMAQGSVRQLGGCCWWRWRQCAGAGAGRAGWSAAVPALPSVAVGHHCWVLAPEQLRP